MGCLIAFTAGTILSYVYMWLLYFFNKHKRDKHTKWEIRKDLITSIVVNSLQLTDKENIESVVSFLIDKEPKFDSHINYPQKPDKWSIIAACIIGIFFVIMAL